QDTTGFNSASITNNATLELTGSTTWNLGCPISGAGSVSKTGTGFVQLSGANTYTGGTTISSGAIQITSDVNLGSDLMGNPTGTLTLNGGELFTLLSLTSGRSVVLAAAGGKIDTATQNSTFSGVFSGPGSLTRAGLFGTLTLTGANTYT